MRQRVISWAWEQGWGELSEQLSTEQQGLLFDLFASRPLTSLCCDKSHPIEDPTRYGRQRHAAGRQPTGADVAGAVRSWPRRPAEVSHGLHNNVAPQKQCRHGK